jgi:hypothetical protein
MIEINTMREHVVNKLKIKKEIEMRERKRRNRKEREKWGEVDGRDTRS